MSWKLITNKPKYKMWMTSDGLYEAKLVTHSYRYPDKVVFFVWSNKERDYIEEKTLNSWKEALTFARKYMRENP